MFVIDVCVLFLIKLRWPKKKSTYDKNIFSRRAGYEAREDRVFGTRASRRARVRSVLQAEKVSILMHEREISVHQAPVPALFVAIVIHLLHIVPPARVLSPKLPSSSVLQSFHHYERLLSISR